MTVKPENEEKLFNALADIKQHNPALYSRIVTAQNQAGVKFVSEQVREKLGKIPAPKPGADGKYHALGRNKDLEDMQKVFQASPELCQGWADFPGLSTSNECKEIKDILPYITGLMKAVVSPQTTLSNEGNSGNAPEPENTLVSQTLTNDGNTLTTESPAPVAVNTVNDADKAKMVSMIEGMNRINGPSKSIDANQTVDKLIDLYGDKSHDLLLKALMEPTNYSNISGKSEISTSRAAVQDLISVDKEHANEYANKILGIETPANTATQGNETLSNAPDPQKFGKDIASFAEIAGKSPELFNALSGIIRAMPEDDPTAQYLSMILTAVSAMKENNALTELPISQQLGQQDMLNQLHTSNPELFGSLQNMLGNIPSPSNQYANASPILSIMNGIAPAENTAATQNFAANVVNSLTATNEVTTPMAENITEQPTPTANNISQNVWTGKDFLKNMAETAPFMYNDFKVHHKYMVKSGDKNYQGWLDIMAQIEKENPDLAHKVNYPVSTSTEKKLEDARAFWTEAAKHMPDGRSIQEYADLYKNEQSLGFPSYVKIIEDIAKKPQPNNQETREEGESWRQKAMKFSFMTNPLAAGLTGDISANFIKQTMKNDQTNAQAVINNINQNGVETPTATRTEIPRVNYNGFMYTLDRGNSGR